MHEETIEEAGAQHAARLGAAEFFSLEPLTAKVKAAALTGLRKVQRT